MTTPLEMVQQSKPIGNEMITPEMITESLLKMQQIDRMQQVDRAIGIYGNPGINGHKPGELFALMASGKSGKSLFGRLDREGFDVRPIEPEGLTDSETGPICPP